MCAAKKETEEREWTQAINKEIGRKQKKLKRMR
jgi:hypothetical protein